MVKLHGPNWDQTVRTVHSWLAPNSPVWLSPETRRRLWEGARKNIFFICETTATQPFDVGMFERRGRGGVGEGRTNELRYHRKGSREREREARKKVESN